MRGPREQLSRRGAAALSDAELLTVILGTGGAVLSARSIAERVLREYGGLTGLKRRSPTELASIAGIGPAKAARLVASLELGARALRPRNARRSPCATAGPSLSATALR